MPGSGTGWINRIRNPIRTHLSAPGAPEPEDIVAIVLIRPISHRVRDPDNHGAGTAPGQAGIELDEGDANFASVDAELALLWQDLARAPIILGVADNKRVTLCDALPASEQMRIPGPSLETYRHGFALIDQHIESADLLRFHSMDLYFDHLADWAPARLSCGPTAVCATGTSSTTTRTTAPSLEERSNWRKRCSV